MLSENLKKEIIDNRDGVWECENCQEKPKTIARVMRGGYIQEILCSECWTDKYPHDLIYMGEDVEND